MEKPKFITEGTFIEVAKKQNRKKDEKKEAETQIPKRELSKYGQLYPEILDKILKGYEPGRFKSLSEKLPMELFIPTYEDMDAKEEMDRLFDDLNNIENEFLMGQYSLSNLTLGDTFLDNFPNLNKNADELKQSMEALSESHPAVAREKSFYKHINESSDKYYAIASMDPIVFEQCMTRTRKFLDEAYRYLSSYEK